MVSAELFRGIDVSVLDEDSSMALLAVAEKLGKYKLSQVNFLTSAAATRAYLNGAYSHLESEIFGVVYLSNQNGVIATDTLFTGTIDGAAVYPREVVKGVMRHNAASVILFHNHPSGESKASDADRRITERLKDALSTIDVRVLDHIILSKAGSLSFAEQGIM